MNLDQSFSAFKRLLSKLLGTTAHFTVRAYRFGLRPLPHIDRWGFYLVAIATVVTYCFWKVSPVYSGYAITTLAFAAVVITVRADKLKSTEKVLWVLFSAVLMGTELGTLSQERRLNEERVEGEQRRQAIRFDATVRDLKALLLEERQHYDASATAIASLFTKSEKIQALTQKSIAAVTGGDSFAVLTLRGLDNGFVYSQGSAPLHAVSLQFVDIVDFDAYTRSHDPIKSEELQALYTSMIVGDFAPNAGRTVTFPPIKRHGDLLHINVFFSALNGFWIEEYVRRYVAGKGLTAIRVTRSEGKKTVVLLTIVDADFPRSKTGEPLW